MKILILKTSSLGDIIHAFPLLAYIKKLHPEAIVDWVVEAPYAELLRAHPDVHKTLLIDTKKWRKHIFSGETRRQIRTFVRELRLVNYDVLFDLQGNSKSALVGATARASVKVGFGRRTVSEWPNLLVTNRKYDSPSGRNIRLDYLYLAQRYFGEDPRNYEEMAPVQLAIGAAEELVIEKIMNQPQLHGKRIILVCPGSAWKNKQMTHEGLLRLLSDISRKESNVAFLMAWGNDSEKEFCNFLHDRLQVPSLVMDRLPLPALQRVMALVDQVIAMDSLPLHLAGTTATPTLSFFGPSSGNKYAPIGDQHQYHQGICPYGRQFEKRCPILRSCPTGACIRKE